MFRPNRKPAGVSTSCDVTTPTGVSSRCSRSTFSVSSSRYSRPATSGSVGETGLPSASTTRPETRPFWTPCGEAGIGRGGAPGGGGLGAVGIGAERRRSAPAIPSEPSACRPKPPIPNGDCSGLETIRSHTAELHTTGPSALCTTPSSRTRPNGSSEICAESRPTSMVLKPPAVGRMWASAKPPLTSPRYKVPPIHRTGSESPMVTVSRPDASRGAKTMNVMSVRVSRFTVSGWLAVVSSTPNSVRAGISVPRKTTGRSALTASPQVPPS